MTIQIHTRQSFHLTAFKEQITSLESALMGRDIETLIPSVPSSQNNTKTKPNGHSLPELHTV